MEKHLVEMIEVETASVEIQSRWLQMTIVHGVNFTLNVKLIQVDSIFEWFFWVGRALFVDS